MANVCGWSDLLEDPGVTASCMLVDGVAMMSVDAVRAESGL